MNGRDNLVETVEAALWEMESLCLNCQRANARPDPEGCAFHRRLNRHTVEGKPYTYAFIVEEESVEEGHNGLLQVTIVVDCPNFIEDEIKEWLDD